MKRSDISDYVVCKAVQEYQEMLNRTLENPGLYPELPFPYEVLAKHFKCSEKLTYSAMERACDNGLIEYGVSLRTGWLTEKGKLLLERNSK